MEVLKGPETLDIVTGNSLGFDETVDTLAFIFFKLFQQDLFSFNSHST